MAKQSPAPADQAPKQELVERPEGSVATADVQAMLLEDAGDGFDTMSSRDLAIPRLAILQALSPTCTKGDPAYIKEAEVGEIIDNIERKRIPGETGIIVIPVNYRRAFIEWDQRKFVADHGTDDSIMLQCTQNEKKQWLLPNGHAVVETAEYYCVMLDPDSGLPKQVVISMSRSMFGEAKRWNSMMRNLMIPHPSGKGAFNPAIYYQSYKLTTIPKSNEDGSWYVWKVEPYKPTLDLVNGSDLYIGSRAFRNAVKEGTVKVAGHDDVAGETVDAGSGEI